MEFEDTFTEKKRVVFALAAAILGWIMYVAKQDWAPDVFIGTLAELIYRLYIYLIMPYAFSGSLFAITAYAVNRVRGARERDIIFTFLSLAALTLAFYVTAPVIGEIGIVKSTAVFFVLRFLRKLF